MTGYFPIEVDNRCAELRLPGGMPMSGYGATQPQKLTSRPAAKGGLRTLEPYREQDATTM